MRRWLVMFFFAASALLGGQAPAQKQPAFEAASIKRNIDSEGGSIGIEPGGRFRAINADIRFMIATMYRPAGGPRLFPQQIVGLPDWASTEKYDMIGKVAQEFAGLSAADQFRRMPAMVQSLLEDRFKLRLHRETRQMPVYALVVSRPNVIRLSTADCRDAANTCRIQSAGGHYSAVGLTLNDFMIFLSSTVERVVIDRTRLQGRYDVELDWSSEPGSDKPSIFTAVQEQLGLKLESDRAPVDVIVIDHIERPTPD